MDSEKTVVFYFNDCADRDHVGRFGKGAFSDLGTTGRQGAQARNLAPGQPCVVAEPTPDGNIAFDWYAFSYESVLSGEGEPDRVFYGRLFASETLARATAARSERYAALFRSAGKFKGHLNIGSVFHRAIRSELVPPESVGVGTFADHSVAGAQTGAGIGDPAENKLVESAAIRAVVKSYKDDGWSVRSVERDKCGFDLVCTKDAEVEQVEVKGVRAAEPCFIITAGEVEQARTNARFFLVVVTSALSRSRRLTKFSGGEFIRRFNLSAIQYRAVLRR